VPDKRRLKIILCLLTAIAFVGVIVAIGMSAPHSKPENQNLPPPPLNLQYPLTGLPKIRGFSIQLDDTDGLANYKQAIDDLSKAGCGWINFVINARQHDIKAESIAMNWQDSPRPADIKEILLYAHQKGIQTMLMPIVLLDVATGDEWRGKINPRNWDQWWDSYMAYITMTARWAQECHVGIFAVGSELLSTEPMMSHWERVLHEVRAIYSGKLTYSANWDHYNYVRFWQDLDFIGMNSYYDLSDIPNPPVGDIINTWQPIQRDIFAFARKQDKPVLLTEIGWDNLQNTLKAPWDYVGTGTIDPNVQLLAYQAFVQVWRNQPPNLFAGAMIWEWEPGSKPTDYGSYSLQGEPALPLVMHWVSGK
jgi:hypothetical protein